MRLVLLGPPGAGKGTQGGRLAEAFGLARIVTGALLRERAERPTELGRMAKERMERGELLPDEVVNAMVFERLGEEDCGDGFVLDGFPRTVAQAEALDRRLQELHAPLGAVLAFEVGEGELLRRLAGRSQEEDRSEDDDVATIQRRLEVFAQQTRPLLDYYARRGLLVPVDAVGPVENVTERIVAGLAQRGLAKVEGSP